MAIQIQGGTSGVVADVGDTNLAQRAEIRPLNITQTTEGSYRMAVTTGDMAAGLAAASPIFEFRNPGTRTVIVHSIKVSAASNGTGFAAGLAFFKLFKLRTHTVIATGAGGAAVAMTTLMGLQRTGQVDPSVQGYLSATAALTIGSGATADTNAIAQSGLFTVGTATLTNFTLGTCTLFDEKTQFPLVLGANEGFTIRATVPATGVWIGQIDLHWSEKTTY